MGFILIQL
jgi:U3 small nucleolar RNA-associated protein 23